MIQLKKIVYALNVGVIQNGIIQHTAIILFVVGSDNGIETKRVNNTLNSSNPEKQVLELLCTRYKNVKVQYKTDLYPWHCDFYIP